MHTTTLKPAGRGTAQMARDVISLFKLRIGVLIMITALVGMAVSPGPAPSFDAGADPGAVGAAGVGQRGGVQPVCRVRERSPDGAHASKRAFVTGALPHHPAWLVLMAVLLAGAVASAWLVLNGAAALHVFLGAFFYGVVYTLWLKRRTSLNIVIGGLAGSFAVLAGARGRRSRARAACPGCWPWCCSSGRLRTSGAWRLPTATTTRRRACRCCPSSSGPARAARIVLVSTVALFVASLLPLAYGAGPVYAVGALAGGLHFVRKSWQLARDPSAPRPWAPSLHRWCS